MKQLIYVSFIAVFCFLLLPGCGGGDDQGSCEIAVTNSYIASAVREFFGGSKEVFCLTSPGMCPGHFDVSPGQIKKLCRCKGFLYFDFQRAVEQSMVRVKESGVKFYSVSALPGMCLPASYLQTCRDVYEKLCEIYPEDKELLATKMAEVEAELSRLESMVADRVSREGVIGSKVVCSRHQVEFAKWLGLDVVASFAGADVESISNIQDSLDKAGGHDIRFVIANKQEGLALAQSLAERLGAEVVVFSNFPQGSFYDMVEGNVSELLGEGK